jgi:hypothetical protein
MCNPSSSGVYDLAMVGVEASTSEHTSFWYTLCYLAGVFMSTQELKPGLP